MDTTEATERKIDSWASSAFIGYDTTTDRLYFANTPSPFDMRIYPTKYSPGPIFGTTDEPDRHPWRDPKGMVDYFQALRGELSLPHLAIDCKLCADVFEKQERILERHGMLPAAHRKRNPGRNKLQRRAEQVWERLRILAQCAPEGNHERDDASSAATN